MPLPAPAASDAPALVAGPPPAERARLARALHDTVIRTLTAIGAEIAAAQRDLAGGDTAGAAADLARLQDRVATGLEEARRTILGLHPAALPGGDLAGALAAELARQAGAAGLRQQFQLAGTPVALPLETEEDLLQIAREALQNVRRHATASSVQVRLEYDSAAPQVILAVEDDGQGFDRRNPLAGRIPAPGGDPDAPALRGAYLVPSAPDLESPVLDLTGYGLLGMEERVRLLGGELRVASGRAVGTLVEAVVPYDRPATVPPVPAHRAPGAQRRVRVVVAADQPLARAGVRRLLEGDPEIEVIAEAADGGAALAEVVTLRPDVLLLDLQLGETDGLAVLARLAAAAAPPAVIVLATYDQDAALIEALRLGARGYVLKQAEAPELGRVIRAAARGDLLLPPGLTARLRGPAADPPPPERLTAREQDVLRLLASGYGTKAMAAQLGLKPGTVKSHLEHLYQKLHVVGRGRGAAVAAARAQGLI